MTRKRPTRRTRRSTGPAGRSAPDPAAIRSSLRADTDVAVVTAETTSIPIASSPPNPTRSEAAARRELIAANRTTTKTTKARSSSPRERTGSPTPARKRRAPAFIVGPHTHGRNPRTTRKRNARRPRRAIPRSAARRRNARSSGSSSALYGTTITRSSEISTQPFYRTLLSSPQGLHVLSEVQLPHVSGAGEVALQFMRVRALLL